MGWALRGHPAQSGETEAQSRHRTAQPAQWGRARGNQIQAPAPNPVLSPWSGFPASGDHQTQLLLMGACLAVGLSPLWLRTHLHCWAWSLSPSCSLPASAPLEVTLLLIPGRSLHFFGSPSIVLFSWSLRGLSSPDPVRPPPVAVCPFLLDEHSLSPMMGQTLEVQRSTPCLARRVSMQRDSDTSG